MPSPRRGRRWAAFAAAYGLLLVAASSASAHGPYASFEYSPGSPAPGEDVTFRSTSTSAPEHTQFIVHQWDLDDDGSFDDGMETVARRTFAAGVHVVRLRVSYLGADGTHVDVAERTVTVGTAPVSRSKPPVPSRSHS